MLTNLVLDLLDFRSAVFPHNHTPEGTRLVALLLAVVAEVFPSPAAVLASRTTEVGRARLGCFRRV